MYHELCKFHDPQRLNAFLDAFWAMCKMLRDDLDVRHRKCEQKLPKHGFSLTSSCQSFTSKGEIMDLMLDEGDEIEGGYV